MQTFFFELYIGIGIVVSIAMLFGSYLKEIDELERKSEKVDKPMIKKGVRFIEKYSVK